MLRNHTSPSPVRLELRLPVFDGELKTDVQVPCGAIPLTAILPLARKLAGIVEQRTVEKLEQSGLRISCREGCAHCCRMLAPVSAVEARRLGEVVSRLPDSSGSKIRAAVAQARQSLQDAGLLDRLRGLSGLSYEEFSSLGREYFGHQIDCPLLERERCLIYEERPLACREHLVTSPPEHCAPDSAVSSVIQVMLPYRTSWAVARMTGPAEAGVLPWIALPLALDWAQSTKRAEEVLDGTELMRRFASGLCRSLSQG
jgi:Fe-S-cluster containining protein